MDDWKSVVAILEELVGQHFTPHRTHEHIALKLHLLSAFVRHAGEFLEKEKDSDKPAPPIVLEPLIKNMLRGADPHGLPKGYYSFAAHNFSIFFNIVFATIIL